MRVCVCSGGQRLEGNEEGVGCGACLGSVSHLPDELDLSTTDRLFEGEDDRDEEEEELEEEEEEEVLE